MKPQQRKSSLPRENNSNMQNNPNNSQAQNPNQNQVKSNPPLGHYTIFESSKDIFIKHEKTNKIISMDRNLDKISEFKNYDEILNMKYITTFQVDSILGILDINKSNKYLVCVTSSKIAAKFKGSYIYNIHNIRLLKITYIQENEDEQKCIKEIIGLFATRNFYYSNDYNLSLSLNMQEKNIQNNSYLINLSFLRHFYMFNIPKLFYSHVIFGYVGCKIDVDIRDIQNGQDKTIDLIIIERVYKKTLLINDDISRQLKQIEFISVYKNRKNEEKIFSTVMYLSNELFYQNIKGVFNPYNEYIRDEIKLFNNIICIVNDIYIIQNNDSFTDFIHSQEELNNKVELINLTSKWKQNLFFESNDNCLNYITSYLSNSNINQEKVFWFIDINNNMINPKYCNDCCFNAIVRILWIAIQKQMNIIGWNINIGLFHLQNKRNLSVKYKEIVMPYHDDKMVTKKYLYRPKIRNLIQVVYDFCFNGKFYNSKNMYIDSNKNINLIDKSGYTDYNKSIYNFALNNTGLSNYDKLLVLCISWNVNNLPIKDNNFELNKLFTENILFKNKTIPDIIFVGLQEIIEIAGPPEKICGQDTTDVTSKWTEVLSKIIENLYTNSIYIPIKVLNLVGVYFVCFIKYEFKSKIKLFDFNVTKTGFDGKFGNKGFVGMTLQYYDNFISVSSGHLEAGPEKNKKRIEDLKKVLKTEINLGENKKIQFKDIDYWIFFGDTNFRIDMDYKDVIGLIEKNNLDYLLKNDQFYKIKNTEIDFNVIYEEKINFNPTYKFAKGENNYDYDENKLRVPSWTDRIFYLKKNGIKNIMYNSINDLLLSDHKPIVGVFELFLKNPQKNIIDNPYINKK